ncbi:MAG: nitrogen regulation protein NR(II), partial [Pseudomonadota bacterium]
MLTTAVVVLDANRTVITMNAAAEDLFQIGRDRIAGKSLQRYFHEPESFHDLLTRSQQQRDRFAEELPLRRLDLNDAPILLDCRASFLDDRDRLMVEFVDVTSRRRINRQERLRTQREIARKMTRQMAHEIKNPLGGLRGAAQLLQRQLDDPAYDPYTNIIIDEADRLAALVDSLLGPGGGGQRQQVNVHDVIEHVIKIVATDATTNIAWTRDYDPSLPLLHLDRDQIVQAVMNIVRNAVAAAGSEGPHGQVTIRTRARTNDTIGGRQTRLVVVIEIIDNGPGIDPAIRDSIFYPLVTSKADGTGIGLSISQELINRHDGLIEFESEV